MASDLLAIARSGAHAARAALDVTAQNIANASTEGYVRRSVQLKEVSASGASGRPGDISLSGVRVDRIVRNVDLFRQAEMRRTGSDVARANAEMRGLEHVEAALEQTGVYSGIVSFEASLQQLLADPVDSSLRAAVLEQARNLARSFNMASSSLDAAGAGMRFEASDSIARINLLARELARLNINLARAGASSSDRITLLDQRDLLLQQIAEGIDIAATIAADETVDVRIGGPDGPRLVSGGSAATLEMTIAADGTISLALDSNAVMAFS
ncbi:MAG: flagellar basal body protein, partial [Novosphingobium sp.]|nr:flagellar basal body protein [Novosphingobium sp.]